MKGDFNCKINDFRNVHLNNTFFKQRHHLYTERGGKLHNVCWPSVDNTYIYDLSIIQNMLSRKRGTKSRHDFYSFCRACLQSLVMTSIVSAKEETVYFIKV